MLELKQYQENALEKLREYFQLAVNRNDVDLAFYELARRPYHRVKVLPDPPYICLRVPTGGGKTLMACHAISIAAQSLLGQERAVVLWLVPTNTIKDQTLAALRDRNHPYRQALNATLDGRLAVMNVEEALSVQRSVVESQTLIIVSTLATPRIGETDKRKLYEQNGSLMGHFTNQPAEALGKLEKYEEGDKPIPSLANVLCLHRPIVVMDEAHNARTDLSFETLARFNPSCIVEFTATPALDHDSPSNVLHSVSAAELKAENMIKLPIRLETLPDWQETIQAARNKRDELEELARSEQADDGDYLRPIVLLQAQKRNDDLPVDTVYEAVRALGVPENQIALETGEHNDLKGIDLFSPECLVRYIITVDKLREGWDCSFAYILCSVREISSRTAVEQILGRVLRMPKARRREHDELNLAYSFVASSGFTETARTLDVITSTLEQSHGFTQPEAELAVQPVLRGLDVGMGGLFAQKERPKTPSERGEPFDIPQLAFWVDGELEPVDEDQFLRMAWNLSEEDSSLSEADFPTDAEDPQLYEIDVDKEGRATSRFITELQQHLALILPCDIATEEQLAVWLDRHIPHPDVVQTQSLLFLLAMVKHLTASRGIPLEKLARERLRLRDAAEAKIKEHRKRVIKTAYDQVLFGVEPVEIEVGPDRVFSYDPFGYPVTSPYQGRIEFTKHYYPLIGSMNDEELNCAQRIDTLQNVQYWVRNIERQPEKSFWLQTSTDKFYPDFVVMLTDGRIAAVEYKGEHIADGSDTEEKVRVGKLWEARSNGKCRFLMVLKADYDAQLRALAT